MKETNTLIVGAGVAGLATAASLQKKGIDFLIIEKEPQTITPWRNHYDRLHLHTNKSLSHLPYIKFPRSVDKYPSRQEVVKYLDEYRDAFGLEPIFNTAVSAIKNENGNWITETNNAVYISKNVVMATGAFGKPKPVSFKGMESFTGEILHSYSYKSGNKFKGKKVLVVGFGNSACEIAIDLYEQGATPLMSVRSPVNIVPRDLLGIPIVRISLLLSKLPSRVADAINAPIMRIRFGDIRKLGLKKKKYGVFEQIQKEGNAPLLDIGTVKLIKEGHIKVFDGIDHIEGNIVFFENGNSEQVDAIVAAIGYDRNSASVVKVEPQRFDDLKRSTSKQQYFGKDGLYFCGYWISPTGQIREIAIDALRIAKDIAEKETATHESHK